MVVPLVPMQTAGAALLVVGALVLVVVIAALLSAIEIVNAYEKTPSPSSASTASCSSRGSTSSAVRLEHVRVRYANPDAGRPRQEAITRDNSPVTADAVVYIKVMDARRRSCRSTTGKRAVSNLAQTTLRAVLGDMELDDTLNKRQEINARIRTELDEAHRRVGDPRRERRGPRGQALEGRPARDGATDLRRAETPCDDPRGPR